MKITIKEDLSSTIETDTAIAGLSNFNPLTQEKFNSEDEVRAFIATSLTPNYFITKSDLPMVDFKAQVVAKVQERLDNFAKTKNYDSILSATTYATSKIERFAKEGQRAVDLRDETWAQLYTIMEEAESGKRPTPTNFKEIEKELPALTWE
jgi:uncharacterized protein YjcR